MIYVQARAAQEVQAFSGDDRGQQYLSFQQKQQEVRYPICSTQDRAGAPVCCACLGDQSIIQIVCHIMQGESLAVIPAERHRKLIISEELEV